MARMQHMVLLRFKPQVSEDQIADFFALLANLQLVGSLTAQAADETGLRCGLLGCFDQNGQAVSGISQFFIAPASLSVQVFFLTFILVIFIAAFSAFYLRFRNVFRVIGLSFVAGLALAIVAANATTGLPTGEEFLRVLAYMALLTGGSVVFSIFWVATSGMDARSVAEQIEGMGMQIPGFRRDPRIVEEVLNRYIPTLTIISGLLVGLLASFADFTGALGTGTGILLTVMIIYQLYENIAQRYVEEMNPALRRFFQ